VIIILLICIGRNVISRERWGTAEIVLSGFRRGLHTGLLFLQLLIIIIILIIKHL